MNAKAVDNEIWNYSKSNHLTIITKDVDFSNKILLQSPPPKVIHIRFGNLKMKDFHQHLSKNWFNILELNETHK
ncbi:MAG: DUF5615 family PIN-like protein [Flavobacterium sp.]